MFVPSVGLFTPRGEARARGSASERAKAILERPECLLLLSAELQYALRHGTAQEKVEALKAFSLIEFERVRKTLLSRALELNISLTEEERGILSVPVMSMTGDEEVIRLHSLLLDVRQQCISKLK